MHLRRPDTSTDFDRVLEVVQACDRAVYSDTDWTPQELREEWEALDLERDAWIAVDDALVVGVMHLPGVDGGMIKADGYVHPDHRGRGVGTLMLSAIEEAFAHEASHRPRAYADWKETVLGGPRFDPELIPDAWDGDLVAGVSLNYAKRMGDWGWIRTLAVREAWRRRGLGLALLREGFRRFAASGETMVALGVDSENPTGAVRLYERAGMSVLWRADVWQKELRSETMPG